MSIKIFTEGAPDAIKSALDGSGFLDEPVRVAGHLRQGKAPSMLGMILGYALVEVVRPRRSKKLPRHFVLAVTDTRVVAFKAWGGSSGDDGPYELRVQPEIAASFDRHDVSLVDVSEKRNGATMLIDGDRFPVSRPNLNGDPSTDELIDLLEGTPRVAPDVALVA